MKNSAKTSAKAINKNLIQKFATHKTAQMLVLGLVVFLLYSQTLRFDYVLDDGEMVVRQPFVVKGIAGIPDILTSATRFTGTFSLNPVQTNPMPPKQPSSETTQSTVGKQRSAYRPLSLITFAAEYQLAENSAVLRHSVNTGLYAVAVIVVFLIFYELSVGIHPLMPFAAALVFAAHPLHTEVVCNIKSRDELLALLCSMTALYLALQYTLRQDWKLLAGAGLLYFCALLSKENAITLLPLFPLTCWAAGRVNTEKSEKNTSSQNQRLLRVVGVIAAFAAVWLVVSLRLASWGQGDSNFASLLNNPYAKAAPEQLLPTKLLVLAEYIFKLVFPLTMSFDYGFRVIEPVGWGWKPLSALVFLLALFAHGIWYIRSKGGTESLPALGLLWLAATMSIASNFFFFSGSAMADRFMFLPSVGFSLALVVGVVWFAEFILSRFLRKIPADFSGKILRNSFWEKAFFVFVGAIALAYAIRTLAYIPAWENPYTLTKAAVEATPRSIKAQAAFNLESLLKAKDEADNSRKASYLLDVYRSASALTELAPAYGRGYYTLALYFERYSVEIPSETAGLIKDFVKDSPDADSARFYYQAALEHEPENPEFKHDWTMFRGHDAMRRGAKLFAKGDTLGTAQQYDSAIARFREALQYNITPEIALANIGSIYARQQMYAEALPFLQKAVALNPYDKVINARLALCSAQEAIERGNKELRQNRLESALAAYLEGTRFGAAADVAWLNVAIVKSRQNKPSEALEAVQKALAANPTNALGKRMLAALQVK